MDGNPCTDPKAKATALNNYFESVFTKENQSNVPTLDSFPNLPYITFSVEGIRRCYLNLIQIKQMVQMKYRHLCSKSVLKRSHLCCKSFLQNRSLQVYYHPIGKRLTFVQYLRKEGGMKLKTIDPFR